jgi:hypothetical protein
MQIIKRTCLPLLAAMTLSAAGVSAFVCFAVGGAGQEQLIAKNTSQYRDRCRLW